MKACRPFFSFYGSKWRAAPYYPPPAHDEIVEPFAGSAGYSLRYPDRKVSLYEIDPVVAGVWQYLIRVSKAEILRLPIQVESTECLKIPQEAKWLIGFWLNKASTAPCKTPSAWMRSGRCPTQYWGESIRQRIADQVDTISHWQVHHGNYTSAISRQATWFIDPPYNCKAGCHYRYHAIDYGSLATWCRHRHGQVLVCEAEGATWLPFQTFRTVKATAGSRGKGYSKEVLFTNRSME